MSDAQNYDLIYHILPRSAWVQAQKEGRYIPDSLDSEGFIHCSTLEQVTGSANKYFEGEDDLLLLEIQKVKVKPEIRFEDLADEGMRFPHIYGPLNLDAVLGAVPFQKNADGAFMRPVGLQDQASLAISPHLLTRLPYPLPGKIYRSPLPFSPLFDPEGNVISAYQTAGVQAVVMLTPVDEVHEVTGRDLYGIYQALGFEVIYAPVEDFWIPDQGGFQAPITQTLQAAQDGKTVAIHCHAGIGRTGIFAACLAKVLFHMDGKAAINWVRLYIPKAVQTPEQANFVMEFELEP
jgi:uncharacterized protein (DUF952 family)